MLAFVKLIRICAISTCAVTWCPFVSAQSANDLYNAAIDALAAEKPIEALEHAESCANLGLDICQELVGMFFMGGLGVEADIEKAISWLLAAENQGSAQASAHLGVIFTSGPFRQTHIEDGIARLQRATAAGIHGAVYNLAKEYQYGVGVEKALVTAHVLFTIAKHQYQASKKPALVGREMDDFANDAIQSLGWVEQEMQKAEIESARLLSEEWLQLCGAADATVFCDARQSWFTDRELW